MECLKDRFYDGVILDGRFQTVSPLNHGSFGMVFMAKDLITDDFVAIKCLTKKSAANDSDSSFAIDECSE
jgi:serine/threonine protein kinase